MSTSVFQPLAEYLEEKLKEALVAQDHVASRKLVDSVSVRINEAPDKWGISGYALEYGVYVNNGRSAGKGKIPLSALIEWMTVVGIGRDLSRDKKNRKYSEFEGLAFVIQKSIHERGIPPEGGYSSHYASGNNIARTGWATATLENEKEYIDKYITEHMNGIVTNILTDFYREWQQL